MKIQQLTVSRSVQFILVLTTMAYVLFGLHYPSAVIAAMKTDSFVTNCDYLAAQDFDEARVAEPVGSEMDVDRAIRECESAIKQFPDNPRLYFQLGAALARKDYSSKSSARIYSLLKRAADDDYLAAVYLLGFLKRTKQVSFLSPDDHKEGLGLLFSAARKGHIAAQALLPAIINSHDVDKETYSEAIALGEKAASKGNLQAMVAVGTILVMAEFDSPEKLSRGTKLLLEAERRGSMKAKKMLGHMQTSITPSAKELLPKDVVAGLQRLTEAANAGETEAAVLLGMFYMNGSISGKFKKDESVSIRWFCRAGRWGHRLILEFFPDRKVTCP